MAGVRIGFKDLYYAKVIEDSKTGVTYGTPARIAKAISGTVTPTVNTETLFADDGPSESASSIGGIEVTLGVDDLSLPTQADLLGKTLVNGVLIDSADDIAPDVAIGFRSLKSNGKYRFVWLLKGKFSLPEESYETKGDTPTFQTPEISGNFVIRDYDGRWRLTGDEDVAGFTAAETWFDAVPTISADSTPPTATVVPANNATAVVVTATQKWTFNKALAENTINAANFMVQKADGSGVVAGSLTLDAAKKVVTFTPAANLAAATLYLALAGVGVRDQSGNALAAPIITKFTTV
ncbi:major tail protein [Paenibacillus sp. FSL M7-0547]|uniref:major tail protein n=1 Tax=Paenibacillus sp. FSL M7-0547 TaxID=2954755 RepID=UPI0030F55953